jgi:ATP-binding protein involved in chromosome partitioning
MTIEKQRVLEALGRIKDPVTGKDLVSAGRIEAPVIDGANVNIKLLLPTLDHPNKTELIFNIVSEVEAIYPGAKVNVHVAAAPPAPEPPENNSIDKVKNIIAVASGKGGVGKSTIAVNLALGLKQMGFKAGLLDADLYGPSIPTMLGLNGERPKVQDIGGKQRIMPLRMNGMPVMSIGFVVEPEQAVVLRGPRLGGIIKQFFMEVMWEELDYLIVDLPPGTGDIQLTLVQTVAVTGAVMVTTPQDVAVADAVKAMNMFLLSSVNVPIIGVVENMAWFTPEDLPERKYFLFGQGGGEKLAGLSGTRVLGQIPIVQGIRESGDAGNPAVLAKNPIVSEAFKLMAKNISEQVAMRNEKLAPTKVVEVS